MLVRVLGANSFEIDSLRPQIQSFLSSERFEAGLLNSTRSDDIDEANTLDLLYVAEGAALDLEVGRRFAEAATATRRGVVSPRHGIVATSADQKVLRRFFAPRSRPSDIPAYRSGAAYREHWDAEQLSRVPMPTQVYFGLTQKCNRSCTFCVSRSFEPAMLDMSQVSSIADEIADHIHTIALTGAGEAMVHPQFFEALDVLHRKLPHATFKMNTSGVTIGRNAERLLQYPIKNITVSLNAATDATYRRFVGNGFEAVLRSLRQLVSVRATLGSDVRLCLSLVLMRTTLPELPALVDIAFDLGIEEVQGIYLMINDDGLADESPWHHPGESNGWIDRAKERGRALGVQTSLPPKFMLGERTGSSQLSSLPMSQGQRCVEPWSTVYLRPDGTVIPCPYVESTLGDINQASLGEIWNGERYQELRRSLAKGEYTDACRHCCGFNETGSVDDYQSHWLGERHPGTKPRLLPLVSA